MLSSDSALKGHKAPFDLKSIEYNVILNPCLNNVFVVKDTLSFLGWVYFLVHEQHVCSAPLSTSTVLGAEALYVYVM